MRFLKGCLLYGVLFSLAALLMCSIAAISLGHFLTTEGSLSPANAIVVLGGENSEFTRTRQAVHLFEQAYAPAVVFVGPSPEQYSLACSPPQRSREIAQDLGLPTDAALIVHGARSTYEEAAELRELVREEHWGSLIIVTDPLHTRRAARTFHNLLPDTTIYVTAAPSPHYDPYRWWRTEEGLVLALSEALKLGFYWAQYHIAPIG